MLVSRRSKYIEIVTAERIKWIGVVRGDLAKLTNYVVNYQKARAIYAQKYKDMNSYQNEMFDDSGHSSRHNRLEQRQLEIDAEQSQKNIEESPQSNEIIELACLLKLRFNPLDDADIIAILNSLIKYASELKPSTKDIDIQQLIDCSQAVLKREWDKVKKETKKWIFV